jgi:LuxR family transcriptional regulator, maltose regulon positive regulatory protein
MKPSIVQTKLVVPRRKSDLVSRTRLIDLLNSLIDYRLILAIAPAGYGKTSLFVDFAHQADIKVSWYTVDEIDREFSTFFIYFVSAVIRTFPHLKDSMIAKPEELMLNQLSVDQLVTIVVNEFYDKIHENFLFVIDDYQLVDGQSEISTFINLFVQLAGDNCHLALLSRKLPALSDLALMIAKSYVGGLSFEELRLQRDETIAILYSQNVEIAEEELNILDHVTEGWVTGLLLTAAQGGNKSNHWARLIRASGINLYDYLARQVLNQQPAKIRQFLLHTSILEEFNAELCESVLTPLWAEESAEWHSLIQKAIANNLFVLDLGEDEPWLRYHHLFQEFLQQTLAREAPEVAKWIRETLAQHLVQHREWEKAFKHYRKLADTGGMSALILLAGGDLLKSGRHSLLVEWFRALPQEQLESDPRLMSLQGILTVVKGQPEEGLTLLERAVSALKTSDQPLLLAQALVRRATAHYQQGNYQFTERDVHEALHVIAKVSDLPQWGSDGIVASIEAEALRLQGLCQFIMGNFSNAAAHLGMAQQKYAKIKDWQNHARVTLEMSTVHMGAGHYQEASKHFLQVLERWQQLHNTVGQANVLNNLGVLYHLQGNYEEALEMFIQALECSRRSSYGRMEAYTLAGIGDLLADLKMTLIAEEFYKEAYPIAHSSNERYLLLHLNLALLLLAPSQDRQYDAKVFIEAAGKLISAETSPFEHGLFCMAVGRYHLMAGRHHEAIGPLQEAVDFLNKTDQRVEAARALLFLAAAQHNVGDHRLHALESVVRALEIANQLEYWHPLVVAGYTVSKFLETIHIEDAYHESVERLRLQVSDFSRQSATLRRRLRQKIAPLLSDSSEQRPNLFIRSLGRGEVYINGKIVDHSQWQTQTARELFFYFLTLEDGVTKEEICEIFWPEGTPEKLKTRFKNAIYRLRNAIPQQVILFENNLYYFNRTLDYEYDVEIFEDAVAIAKQSTGIKEKRIALQQVARLYKGEFLPEANSTWVQFERERLWRLYVDSQLDLSQLCLEAGDLNEALVHCQRLLLKDPCLESAHRLVMTIHGRRGNRANVARQYEECCTALLNEFGVGPSSDTDALYDQLMR